MAFKFEVKKAVREKIYTKIALMGSSGCVDAETEFFTGKGWKRIADYEPGDKVLQYDEITGNATLVEPEEFIKLPADYMYHFKTKYGLDQCLSPEHNVAYLTDDGEFNKTSMEEVRKRHELAAAGFSGHFITTFNYSGSGINLSDEEIELMLAVICDGSFLNSGNRCRFHVKKDRKKERLEELFKKCNLEYKTHQSTAPGYTDYYVNVPRHEKEFGADWYNCNQHQLQIICNNIMFWDGNETPPTKNGVIRKRFSANNKVNADFVQFVFSACGQRANLLTRNRVGQIYKTSGKYYERISEEYNVTVSDRIYPTIKNSHNKVRIERVQPSDGFKYCFSVPTQNLVLRYNNRIFITGNCGKTYSALRLATGMAQEIEKETGKKAKILMGNTEASRGAYYANEFDYDKVDLSAPYNPELFVDLINFAVNEGYDILIIDSSSHEWEGKGGCLELQQQAGGKYQDWAKISPRHDKFVEAIAFSQIHIISTMRAKDQYEVDKDSSGKISVRKLGLGPKQRDGIEYEYTATLMLDGTTHAAKAQKDNTKIFEFDPMAVPSEEHGRKIIQWANSGDAAPTVRPMPSNPETPAEVNEIEEKRETLASLVKALTDAGVTREAIADGIKKHHTVRGKASANYNTISDIQVMDAVINELESLSK